MLLIFTFVEKKMSNQCKRHVVTCSESSLALPTRPHSLQSCSLPQWLLLLGLYHLILQKCGLSLIRTQVAKKMFLLSKSSCRVSCSLSFFFSISLAALEVPLA